MDQALKTMIDNLPEKTGKSLSEWSKILREKAFAKHGEAMKFMKEECGVSHGYANTIIQLAKEDKTAPVDLVKEQYAKKELLKPIYDELHKNIISFGKDVSVSPKKESVSFIRKKQFVLIKPATKTRIDVGLKLTGKPTTERLENSGPFGAMCTHRVQIERMEDIDQELMEWMKEAYEKAN